MRVEGRQKWAAQVHKSNSVGKMADKMWFLFFDMWSIYEWQLSFYNGVYLKRQHPVQEYAFYINAFYLLLVSLPHQYSKNTRTTKTRAHVYIKIHTKNHDSRYLNPSTKTQTWTAKTNVPVTEPATSLPLNCWPKEFNWNPRQTIRNMPMNIKEDMNKGIKEEVNNANRWIK